MKLKVHVFIIPLLSLFLYYMHTILLIFCIALEGETVKGCVLCAKFEMRTF